MRLFYNHGYFRQRLSKDGWQEEEYLETNVKQLPLELALGKDQQPITVTLETRTGTLLARVWKLAVGHALESEVIPLYYKRDSDGVPLAWIARMKAAIRRLGWRFNADRMVMDYVTQCYIPAAGGTSSELRQG